MNKMNEESLRNELESFVHKSICIILNSRITSNTNESSSSNLGGNHNKKVFKILI